MTPEPVRESRRPAAREMLPIGVVAVGDVALREAIVGALRSEGRRLIAVDDSTRLICTLAAAAARGRLDAIAFVVCSERLADGSGFDALAHLRARGIGVAFVLVSPFDSEELREAGRTLGARTLPMPFGLADLDAAIEGLRGRRHS